MKRILKRPMFRMGGDVENVGIMDGMRKRYATGTKPEDIDATYTAAGAGFRPRNQNVMPQMDSDLARKMALINFGQKQVTSDIRLKTDIELTGKSPAGVNIYSFKYKGDDKTYEGVLAQEVPWASIKGDDGYYKVDYSKVDVEFKRLN